MRIALTGASGFIGSAAARAIHAAGHEVTAMVRPSSPTEHISSIVTRFVRGDQKDPAIWPEFLEGADAVIHNALDRDALRSGDVAAVIDASVAASVGLLDEARRRGVGRFVFVSSVATHHDIRPRWGGEIDEDHPLRPASLYGATKAAVEPFLWWAHHEFGLHTAAVRPAGVYGVEPVHVRRSIAYEPVARIVRGEPVSKDDFPGGGKWVSVEDVALAMLRAAERDGAAGRAFNLADCYAKRTRFAELAAEALGRPRDLVDPVTGPPAVNRFTKDASRDVLGVPLDRGEEGLRAYVRELVGAIEREAGAGKSA